MATYVALMRAVNVGGRNLIGMSEAIERTLGTRGTGRNWNTVVKLAALAAS